MLVQSTVYAATDTTNLFDLSLEELLTIETSVASAFSEDLLSASSSVTLVEREQWQQYGSSTAFDVLSHMPSVMVYPTLGSGAIAIRGYAAGFSTVRGVATVLDGVPLNTLAFGAAQYDKSNLGLETLDRIEIIRGPGSSIYGSDAFHGVFSSSTYLADGEELTGSLDADHLGYYQAGLRSGMMLAGQHQLSLSFSGSGQATQDISYYYTDPLTSEVGTGDYDYLYDTQSLSIKLGSELTDSAWYYEAAAYINNHEGVNFSGIGNFFNGLDQREQEHVDLDSGFELLRGHLGYRLQNGVEVEYKQFYWESQLDHRIDFSQVSANNGIQLTRDNEHRRGSTLIFRQKSNDWHTEWVASLAYDKTTIDDNLKSIIAVDGTEILPEQISSSQGKTRATKSLVLQAKTWFGNDRYALLYGGRIDNNSDTVNQKTPRLGLIFRADQYSSLKFLYGKAFRAPIAAEVDGVGVLAGSDKLEAETIDTYELIYMHQRESFRAEVVLFYSEWKDTIVPVGGGAYQNFGDSKATGIELIGEGVSDYWFWRGSLSYTNSENTTSNQDYTIFPEVIANVDFGYRFPAQKLEIVLSNRVNYKMDEGSDVGAISNPDSLPHYWRSDLQFAKNYGNNSRVAITFINLFDRENYLPSVWNTENGLEEKPFTVQLSWQHRFF